LCAGTVTGTISLSKCPDSCAATARVCEISAHASCASRLTLRSAATFSAVMPMEMYASYSEPSEPSSLGCSSNGAPGAVRETASTPAAMYVSPSPDLIAWNAMRVVCSEDAQKRLTVQPGTW
jgi:hypothetical protein